MTNTGHIWHRRGRRLQKVHWGVWEDLDRPGWYFLCYRPFRGNGKQVQKFIDTNTDILDYTDIRNHVRAVRARRELQKLDPARNLPAEQTVNDYLRELQRRGRSEQHVRDIRRTLTAFLECVEPVCVGDITARDLERFLGRVRREGASPRTHNKKRALLGGWFNWAVKHGYLDHNPVTTVEPTRQVRAIKKAGVDFPTPDDFAALVEAAPCRYDVGLFTLFVMTGLRRGSVLGLTAEAFTPDGILVTQTKERTEWFLGYDDGCPLWRPELSKLGKRLWAEGKPTRAYLRAHLEQTCRAAGKQFNLHSLRHAFCSWLTMMGESLQDVQAWAHHSSVTTTEKWYAHLRPHGRERAQSNRENVLTTCERCLCKGLSERA